MKSLSDIDQDMATEGPPEVHEGGVRVGNKRVNAPDEFKPEAWEVIIHGDRPNILGNPHKASETCPRDLSIRLFRRDLLSDIIIKGPMFQECLRIAKEVKAGKEVILMCWCHPLPCHLDSVSLLFRPWCRCYPRRSTTILQMWTYWSMDMSLFPRLQAQQHHTTFRLTYPFDESSLSSEADIIFRPVPAIGGLSSIPV